jgi:hypothetical protein
VDEARLLLTEGQWEKARDQLDSVLSGNADPLARGLAAVYRGVVFAEMGTGNEEEARKSFQQALTLLEAAAPADRLRAHNNYGDFLQQQAQDGLYNHSLQLAAGVERPFLGALRNWMAAHKQYEKALALAAKTGAADRAGVEVNLARLYTLLGDVARWPDKNNRTFTAGASAADRRADELAARAASAPEPVVRAVAANVRAHLARRAGDDRAAYKYASQTRDLHLAEGNVAGVEYAERVLGLTSPPPRTTQAFSDRCPDQRFAARAPAGRRRGAHPGGLFRPQGLGEREAGRATP